MSQEDWRHGKVGFGKKANSLDLMKVGEFVAIFHVWEIGILTIKWLPGELVLWKTKSSSSFSGDLEQLRPCVGGESPEHKPKYKIMTYN